mmetsp:Transcript_9887/g.18988  ORF Transcript_9887/g.18988 Transcript_9887/m.18988 type:complete len:207 (-) Transcript_9887:845-1465(-)
MFSMVIRVVSTWLLRTTLSLDLPILGQSSPTTDISPSLGLPIPRMAVGAGTLPYILPNLQYRRHNTIEHNTHKRTGTCTSTSTHHRERPSHIRTYACIVATKPPGAADKCANYHLPSDRAAQDNCTVSGTDDSEPLGYFPTHCTADPHYVMYHPFSIVDDLNIIPLTLLYLIDSKPYSCPNKGPSIYREIRCYYLPSNVRERECRG